MHDDDPPTDARHHRPIVAPVDRRDDPRRPLHGTVVVRLRDHELEGAGRDVSAGGVHVVVARLPAVTVHVDGRERRGELVRLENLGPGRVGLAIRFVDDGPTLAPETGAPPA